MHKPTGMGQRRGANSDASSCSGAWNEGARLRVPTPMETINVTRTHLLERTCRCGVA
jgi:hypothetical protein